MGNGVTRMRALLSNAPFREVRPEFFRVLAGQKTGRLYVDALDALERVAAQRVQGIDRDDAVTLARRAAARRDSCTISGS